MKLHKLISACAVFLIVCTPALVIPAIGQNTKKITPEFSDVDGIQSEFASIKSPKSKSKLKTVVGQNASPIVKLMEFPGSGMSGIYQVPGSSHDGYPLTDIGTAIAILNSVGLVGDVVFELTDTSYHESSVVIGGAYQNADMYKVTMRPVVGASVKVHFISTSSDGKGFVFSGAKNVTIDGLNTGGASLTIDFNAAGSVFPIDDPFGATVYITGASAGIALKNTHIKGQANNSVWANQTEGRSAFFIFAADADAGPSTSITLDSCTITNATYAIKALPQSNGHNSVEKFTVNDCKIGGAYGEPVVIGALVEYSAEITYTKNIVDGVTFLSNYLYNTYTEYDDDVVFNGGPFMYSFSQVTGGHWLMMDEGTWADNIFCNITTTTINGDGIGCYGIRVYGYDLGYGGVGYVPTLYNNRIYGITNDDNNGYIFGIRGLGVNIYHNSVRLTGTNTNSPSSTCCRGDNNVKNNAFSNEINQPNMSRVRGVTPDGTIDGNAIYSAGQPTNNHSTISSAVAAGVNPNGTWGSVNFTTDLNVNCPSSADNSALPRVLLEDDINGQQRDTTAGGVRDAGAYEFPTCGTSFGPDVFPAKLVSPVGYLIGCTESVKVMVKNNSNTSVGPFNLNVVISGPENHNATNSVSLMPMECKVVTMAQQWTPTGGGTRTATITTSLTGDINTGNDVINTTILLGDPIWSMVYTFDTGPQGWVGTSGPGSVTDWKRSNSFTKLGGPFSGYSWVIERPNKPSTYTEGAYASSQGYLTNYPGPNLLTSPVMGFSCWEYDEIWIGFWHSIRTEPYWDKSWMQYTTDGITWKHLGKLNDPNGMNWYSEDIYHNALWEEPECDWPPCEIPYQDELNITFPLPTWTSNGANYATGPFGWVFSELKITSTEYPDIIGSPYVQFRYVAYSDPATAEDPGGWAFDNFSILPPGPRDNGGTIAGTVFQDVNGNGVQDAEEYGDDGVKMHIYYYDALKDSTITAGGGNYTYNLINNNNRPGIYRIKCVYPGYAFTVPFGASGIGEVFHPSDWSPITQNFGRYLGSVGGMKFDDRDNDGTRDPEESGLGGWTIELHKDSANGEVVNSVNTASNGTYTMLVPPYPNYILKESLTDTTIARCTYPPPSGTHAFAIGGNSGSETAIITGKDFGNFVKAVLLLEISQDRNGNGVRDSSDGVPLPVGTEKMFFDLFRDGNRIAYDSLSNGQSIKIYDGLDLGTYRIRRLSPAPPGWIQTSPYDSITFIVNRGSFRDTANFLYFHPISVTGTKFNDANTNGIKDNGEGGMPGWSISISGTGGSSTVTDNNGNYTFEGIGPGIHTISESQQTGWVQTAPSAGSYTFSAVTADQGGNISSMDFGNYFGIQIPFSQGWNLVSLPVNVADGRRFLLFPGPTYSQPYGYLDGGYLALDTMFTGLGYWIKSTSTNMRFITGFPIESDSIQVSPGWNLIGSISSPLPVAIITSEPPGLTVSQFFGYSGQYAADDTLHPGTGYWIKVGQAGEIFLSSEGSGGSISKNKIRIIPISELPPPPPFANGDKTQEIPDEYNMEQNYPNPFNPVTKIRYALPAMSEVRLTVYNILGQEVTKLVDGVQDAGYKEIDWNASSYMSGIYFYRIQAISAADPTHTFSQVRKMLLIK